MTKKDQKKSHPFNFNVKFRTNLHENITLITAATAAQGKLTDEYLARDE